MSAPRLGLSFRITHWVIAISVIFNAFVLEEGDAIHRYLGYLALAMVVVRLGLSKRRPSDMHYNPKAVYVYYAIWAMIAVLGISGFMMGLDRFWGNQTLEDIHEAISNFLLILVSLHLFGVFFDAYKNKRKTWMLMISGVKK